MYSSLDVQGSLQMSGRRSFFHFSRHCLPDMGNHGRDKSRRWFDDVSLCSIVQAVRHDIGQCAPVRPGRSLATSAQLMRSLHWPEIAPTKLCISCSVHFLLGLFVKPESVLDGDEFALFIVLLLTCGNDKLVGYSQEASKAIASTKSKAVRTCP